MTDNNAKISVDHQGKAVEVHSSDGGDDADEGNSLHSHGETSEAGSSRSMEDGTRQAGPLPIKRGEIGFHEPEDNEVPAAVDPSTDSPAPARHPADRETPSTLNPAAPPPPGTNTAPTAADASSTHTCSSTRKILNILRPKRVPVVRGVRLTTVLLLVLQVMLFVGTIAGWILLSIHLPSFSNSSESGSSGTSQIFVHVAFTIATLAQLIFVERRIYRVRAERYVHVHGGLPTRNVRDGDLTIGLAPWNRPPLPTYAAALAQSGVGTGDVEDSAIAVPPPPAYGNTRGSTLLLQGFLTDTLRAQRADARARARAAANANAETGSMRASWASVGSNSSRPASYMSHDEEWEGRRDVMRAVRLEETLARLEDVRVRDART